MCASLFGVGQSQPAPRLCLAPFFAAKKLRVYLRKTGLSGWDMLKACSKTTMTKYDLYVDQ